MPTFPHPMPTTKHCIPVYGGSGGRRGSRVGAGIGRMLKMEYPEKMVYRHRIDVTLFMWLSECIRGLLLQEYQNLHFHVYHYSSPCIHLWCWDTHRAPLVFNFIINVLRTFSTCPEITLDQTHNFVQKWASQNKQGCSAQNCFKESSSGSPENDSLKQFCALYPCLFCGAHFSRKWHIFS